jgi:hypothetical protein
MRKLGSESFSWSQPHIPAKTTLGLINETSEDSGIISVSICLSLICFDYVQSIFLMTSAFKMTLLQASLCAYSRYLGPISVMVMGHFQERNACAYHPKYSTYKGSLSPWMIING